MAALNLLAVARDAQLEPAAQDLVVVHDRRALPACRAIAERRRRPLLLLERLGGGAGPWVMTEELGPDAETSRRTLDRHRALLTREAPARANPVVDLVVLGRGLAWEWIEPLLLRFESVRVTTCPAPVRMEDLASAKVVVLAGEREDASAVVSRALDAGALPMLLGEAPPHLDALARRGVLVRVSPGAAPAEAERWLTDPAGRARFVSAARGAALPSELDPLPPFVTPAHEAVTMNTSTVRVASPPVRPLRVVLNHGGLVAEELAESLRPLGWALEPLLGQGRDPLPAADFLVVLPYGDPSGALAAARRARRMGVPVAFWNVEDPRYFLDPDLGPTVRALAQESSVVFSTTRQLEDEYRQLGVEREYLPVHGRGFFLESSPLPESGRSIDLLFLGTLTPDRWRFLDELRLALGPAVSFLVSDELREPSSMLDAVRSARIGLSYGTLTDTPELRGAGVTERVFDYPLAGTPVLCDTRDHLPELFTPGEEVFVFQGLEQAIERVRELLADPARRERAARRARAKVLACHLGRHRVLRIARALLERGHLRSGGPVQAAIERAAELVGSEEQVKGSVPA